MVVNVGQMNMTKIIIMKHFISHGLRYHFTLPLGATISSRQCILWQVDIGLPSLKYSNILHAKCEVGKSEIIINSFVLKLWFTSVYLQVYLSNPEGQHFYCIVCI